MVISSLGFDTINLQLVYDRSGNDARDEEVDRKEDVDEESHVDDRCAQRDE